MTKDAATLRLETEIIKVKSEVDVALLRVVDDEFTTQLKELRDRVLLSHSIIESFMEFLILTHVLSSATPNSQGGKVVAKTELTSFIMVFNKVQKGFTFIRKLELLKDFNLIQDESYTLIKELNNIRVNLAHTKTKNYKIYETGEEYKKALNTILKVLQWKIDDSQKPYPLKFL